MIFDILTLFPELVGTVLGTSVIGRAQKAGFITVNCFQIRDFSTDRHRNTDDTPCGGGSGMVMTAQPIYDCFLSAIAQAPNNERRRVIYMSPKGSIFTQAKAAQLASYDRLVILCGHYEGVDQRVIDEIVDEEISVGDYVLTGGEIPACILTDAVARQTEGVLACEDSYRDESIACGLLEYPQYTKPALWMGREVPQILLSGHHVNIDKWRQEQSLNLTKERRPDLYEAWTATHPEKEKKKKRSDSHRTTKSEISSLQSETENIKSDKQ